jgi:endo-1,4-beta-xylanase
MGKKSNMVYNLVSRLKSLNLVDGIGLQCHFHRLSDTGVGGAWNPTEMTTNLARLAALGLRISFTEVDIRIPTLHTPLNAADSANLTEQRNEYYTLMSLFLAQPNCESFFTWGVNDSQSWIPTVFTAYGAPLLFYNTRGTNGEYVPKLAYYGVRDALMATGVLPQAPNSVLRIVPATEPSNQIYDLLGRRLNMLPHSPPKFVVKPGVKELKQ